MEWGISSLTHSLARRESKLVVDSAKSVKREGEGEHGISSSTHSLIKTQSESVVILPRTSGGRGRWSVVSPAYPQPHQDTV